jgi:hypothetical protein
MEDACHPDMCLLNTNELIHCQPKRIISKEVLIGTHKALPKKRKYKFAFNFGLGVEKNVLIMWQNSPRTLSFKFLKLLGENLFLLSNIFTPKTPPLFRSTYNTTLS